MTAHSATNATAATEPAFNLIDEPWLPVQWRGNSGAPEVGLGEVFERAGDIAGLAEPSPPVFVALHRLLLAITHRALTDRLGSWKTADRARWLRDGLPAGVVADYLARWRDRFWLFHPTLPFMQVSALQQPLPPKADKRFGILASTEEGSGNELPAKAWTQIALEHASGNNPVLFDHALDAAPPAVAPAIVLRQLLGYLQFVPGQPVKALCKVGNDSSGPLFNSLAVVPIGISLSETLALALPPAAIQGDDTDDRPAWERPPPGIADLLADATPAGGPCDRFTRLTRAVLIRREADGNVRQALFAEGRALRSDPAVADPMVSYRPGANETWVRLTFNEGRAVWRDLGAMLPDPTGRLARPAPVLDGALRVLQASGQGDQALGLCAAGLAADQGKMLRGRIERHRLPLGVLTSAEAAAVVREALRRAEEAFAQLRALTERATLETLPDPKHKDSRAHARRIVASGPLMPTFFARAEQQLPFVLGLIGQAELDQAHQRWGMALRAACLDAWSAASAALGAAPRALRAVALTQDRVWQLMRQIQPDSTRPIPTAKQGAPS